MAVYFVQAGDGPIKIGFSDDVERRIGAMRTDNHAELRLLGVVDGDEAAEQALHVKFRSARIRGEWFRPSEELLFFIASNARRRDNRARRPLPGRARSRHPLRLWLRARNWTAWNLAPRLAARIDGRRLNDLLCAQAQFSFDLARAIEAATDGEVKAADLLLWEKPDDDTAPAGGDATGDEFKAVG